MTVHPIRSEAKTRGARMLRPALGPSIAAWLDDAAVIEVMLNQELGEPFRRDAMKKPVSVAGINRDDMRPQEMAS